MIDDRDITARIFLRFSDRASHRDHPEWGEGKVVHISTSTLPGGAAYVRILFDDGKERTFNNDLNDARCAYYMGLVKIINGPGGILFQR